MFSIFTGLWYGQEKLGYPALLILLECYAINICATDISLKVISLQLKGHTSTEWLGFCFKLPSQSLVKGKYGDKYLDLPQGW
jgi:hypothetical protein